MNTKEAIKQILNLGGSVKFSYKRRIDSWYSDIKIFCLDGDVEDKDKISYFIDPMMTEFTDIDKAINTFCDLALTSKNVGYIQDKLSKKGIDFEEYDMENPSEELKKLFKDESAIVDEEAEQFNYKIN